MFSGACEPLSPATGDFESEMGLVSHYQRLRASFGEKGGKSAKLTVYTYNHLSIGLKAPLSAAALHVVCV